MAVIELTTREIVSGAARLVSGFMRLAQLAFGILIATQVVGISAAELSSTPVNKFGPWAPWLGVAVYAVGIMLYLGPPTRFLPWLTVVLFVAYLGQFTTNLVFGSYASGFGGGFALMLFAMAISLRPDTPPTAALLLPGFWLLVPGSIGLIGVTQLVGADSSRALTVTLVSMIAIALGLQTGLLVFRAARQLAPGHEGRCVRDGCLRLSAFCCWRWPTCPHGRRSTNLASSVGPFASLLAGSADLGPARTDQVQLTVALTDSRRPAALMAWAGDNDLSVRWRPR